MRRSTKLEVLLDAYHDAGQHPDQQNHAVMRINIDPIVAAPFVSVGGRRRSCRGLLLGL